MPTPQFPGVPDYDSAKSTEQNLKQLYDAYIGVNRYLTYLLSALDTLNVSRLDAKVIIADSITSDKIKAGAVTADKIDVNELSAISANLGHIIAGIIETVKMIGSQIYGSYIATREGVYPRSEMNASGDYFAALASATNYARMLPFYLGSPALEFYDGATTARLSTFSVFDNYFMISCDHDIRIAFSDPSNRLRVPSWSRVVNESNSQTLQSALDSKANAFFGYTGAVSTGTNTLNFVNGILASVT